MSVKKIIPALLLALFTSALLSPAQTQQPQQSPGKIVTVVNLIVLSVTVKDANNHLVYGLDANDFHVFEDSVEQKISLFENEGFPLSMVVLIDSDMKWKEGSAVAKSLRSVANGLSDTDEAMVCRYDMLFYPGSAFTNYSTNLLSDLKAAQVAATPSPQYVPQPMITGTSSTTGPPPIAAPTYSGSRPSKALDDALFSSAELLEQRPIGRRRVILLISDGVNEPKLNHHRHDEVVDLLLQKNISVYSLAVGSEGFKHKFYDLGDYSAKTGGDIFYAKDSDSMAILYSRIATQARHDYILAYAPPDKPNSSSTPEFRSIKVTTNNPGQTALTRSGYYASASSPPVNQP
jgi:Ca-activated chloride channel homolog